MVCFLYLYLLKKNVEKHAKFFNLIKLEVNGEETPYKIYHHYHIIKTSFGPGPGLGPGPGPRSGPGLGPGRARARARAGPGPEPGSGDGAVKNNFTQPPGPNPVMPKDEYPVQGTPHFDVDSDVYYIPLT